MIGTTVSHYEVRERLGGGGMGEVFKAWDTRLDRFVALKFLAPELSRDRDLRERFKREAKAASSLDHPNLCVIHDIDQTAEGRLFICMTFYDGETLKSRLRRGPLAVDDAAALAIQISRGLLRAHEAGIVHRDLKPANVMVTDRGEAKIVDFGLAKLVHEARLTRTGATMGTVAYMSPEQLRGEQVDQRTDLWSLGVLLYEMLTGELPFGGGSAIVAQRQILEGPLPGPPSAQRPEVPRELDDLVSGLLVRVADQRMPSARAVISVLATSTHPAVSQLPTEAVAWKGPAQRGRARRRALIAGLAGVAALVAAAGVYFGGGLSQAREYRTLAVLPFDNYTGDESKGYLSEGLAAGLITSLSEIADLQVLSRAEAWGESVGTATASDLGHQLGVESILAGSVMGGGERDLEVEVQLINVGDGSVVWSERISGPQGELPELQRRIAERLTEVLEIQVSRRERRRLARDPTRSYRAYDSYLQGQKHLERLSDPRALEDAAERFREALRLDPEFALAHVGLSEAYWRLFERDGDRAALDDAASEAGRALEDDPELPAARVAMARIQRSQGRVPDSLRELQKALGDHPNPDEAYRELGHTYERLGDLEQAEAAFRSAVRVGSEFWLNWNALGGFHFRLGRFAEAGSAFARAADEAPAGITQPEENRIVAEFYRGRTAEALAAFEALEALHPEIRSARFATNIGTAYYFSDRPDKWERSERFFRRAVELDPRNDMVRRNLADLLRTRGREGEALEHYRTALQLVDRRLELDPENPELALRRAFFAANVGDCEDALQGMDRLEGGLAETAQRVHMSGYVYALCDRREDALAAVAEAIRLGISAAQIRQEPEFSALAGDPEFERLTTPP